MDRLWKRVVVGSFDIIAGGFALWLCLLAVASISAVRYPLPSLRVLLAVGVAVLAVLGTLALAGGVCALLGKARWLALIGSMSASISLPPLGVPAAMLVLLSTGVPKVTRLVLLVLFGPLWLLLVGMIALILLGYGP